MVADPDPVEPGSFRLLRRSHQRCGRQFFAREEITDADHRNSPFSWCGAEMRAAD